MIFVNQVNRPLTLTEIKTNEHSPSSGMSMAAVVWKAQIQVITPRAATNPRLLCDLMFSRWILDVLKKQVLSLRRPQFISLVRWRCGTCESSTDGEGPMNPPTRWHTERQTPNTTNPPWLEARLLSAQPGITRHTARFSFASTGTLFSSS